MNKWTWAYIAVTAGVLGYWQRNIAAGIFMFLFLLLLTRMLDIIVNMLFRVEKATARVEKLLHERLEDPTGGCTGYKDCPCWWHTEQRQLSEKKQNAGTKADSNI